MTPAATAAEPEPAKPADRVRGRLMHAALKAMLDQVRGARAAFPHLAALEEALGQRGFGAIDEVPVQWLAKITTQLGSLPLRDEDLELQDLLDCLCRAVARHRAVPAALPVAAAPVAASAVAPSAVTPSPAASPRFDVRRDSNHLSEFHDSSRMEVREISHSAFLLEFDAAQQETAPMPLPLPPATGSP